MTAETEQVAIPVSNGSGDKTDVEKTELISNHDQVDATDEKIEHLEKIADYITYGKGLMNIALLTANANQLRYALELDSPFRTILITLLIVSILLQLVASCILFAERVTYKTGTDYHICHRYNIAIGVIVIFIIVVNVIAIAFGAPTIDIISPTTPKPPY